ncbi:CDP-glycerol glycerophosphotransferase family protein [Aeromonas caviae]
MFLFTKKILIRFIQFLVYGVSFFVKRDKKKWVFGSFGHFNDNSRYLYEYVVKYHPEIRAIWLSEKPKSVNLASEIGESYLSTSLKGFWISLTSGVYIFSSYVSDICWYTSGRALKVNLWHGVPLKKIEFDITTPPLVNVFRNASFISKFRYPHAHIKHDLVLSPSVYIAQYSFISAFRLDGMQDIVVSMYPRVLKIVEIAKTKSSDDKKFTFLYAPTWRDSGADFISDSGIDFYKINDLLVKLDAVLLIKLHSATKLNCDIDNFDRIVTIDNQQDPCISMAQADCLITDYSSMYFDYLVMDRPIIFYPFDKIEYLNGREFYFDYDQYTPGLKAMTFTALLSSIEQVAAGHDVFSDERRKVRTLFMESGKDGNDKLFKSILAKLNV